MKRSSEPTERYLQSVLEIAEDSGRATRAEIARRLHRHPVTIAETTDRLQQAGLIYLLSGRRIHLTVPGTARALAIVRKHRVIECFLDQVVGLEWALVHREAVRWQHVVSDDVEARMARLLGRPRTSPYGCAVPGIDELLHGEPLEARAQALVPGCSEYATTFAVLDLGPPGTASRSSPLPELVDRGQDSSQVVVVYRISENLQSDPAALGLLEAAGVVPGAGISIAEAGGGTVKVRAASREAITMDRTTAAGIRAFS